MVRGNWQKRVETAEARRVAAKQRKQRRENKGLYKSLVNDLLALLDRHANALLKPKANAPPWILHIWTDTLPSDRSLPVLYNDDKDGKSKRRKRSSSFHEQITKGKRKANSSGSKKKSHPRSHENLVQEEHEEAVISPQMCQDYFFTNKCEGSQRKGGCRHVHVSKRETLCNVMKGSSSFKEMLAASLEATMAATTDGASDAAGGEGVDMVYHVEVPLSVESNDSEDANFDFSVSVHDKVQKVLSDKSCSLGCIVYATVNNVLLFDRYRDGLILTEEELVGSVLGEGKPSRATETKGEEQQRANSNRSDVHPALLLPASILEHVLTFLPDTSVPVMCKVCKAWKREIGTTSPSLWKHLLERHKWPIPESEGATSVSETEADTATRDLFRNAFLSHYSVVRNVRAMQEAMPALTGSTRRPVEEKEMVFQSFGRRREAPHHPNRCVALKVWSPRRVLAAYSHDCTLRLFEAVEKPVGELGTGCSRGCREVVCILASPFKSVKTSCRLVAMDFDDDMIACLCHSLHHESSDFFLVTMSREDFLCAAGTASEGSFNLDDDTVNVVNVEEAVRTHLEDNVDMELIEALSDYIDVGDNGYNLGNLRFEATYNLAACGHGRFVVEVTISMPNELFEEDAEHEHEMAPIDRKLVLFSAATGSIVGTGRSCDLDQIELGVEFVCRQGPSASSQNFVTIALASHSSIDQRTWSVEIHPDGEIQLSRRFEMTDFVLNAVTNGWRISRTFHHPLTITRSHVVVVNNMVRLLELDGEDQRWVAVVLCYSRSEANAATPTGVLCLRGVCAAFRMESFGDEHVVILCRVYVPSPDAEPGHDTDIQRKLYAIIVHVPTCREIQRVFLTNEGDGIAGQVHHGDIPMFLSSHGDTVGLGVWHDGIVLTGSDVRSVDDDCRGGNEIGEQSSTKKKKKKRQSNRCSKKDGFARGMSLRG